MKLLSIRELVDNESTKSSIEFQALVDQHGHKIFLEKFQILEDIERKIFYRMLMIEHVPNEYHQLNEIVSLQEFLALDSASSLPIHRVCEKLQKFVRNYQTSYERWIDILNSLQDELLIQVMEDYDEYMGRKETETETAARNFSGSDSTRIPSFVSPLSPLSPLHHHNIIV